MRYRELATRPLAKWAIVSVGARLPVAMATLALVFLVRDRPGGYALGAGLAAVYVLGEVVGALVFGPRLKPDRARRQLAVGLALGGSSFAVLGFLPGAPLPVLGVFAALAGAAPAAAPGGLRTLLTSQLPEALVVTALSAESVLTFIVWTAAPALTVVLALSVSPSAPLLLAAVLMVAASAGLWALPAGWEPDPDHDGVSKGRTLARAWPIFVTAAAAASLFALTELVLPALLEQRGFHVGWAGPLLAGFSTAAVLGAALYGSRGHWPGSVRGQSMALLLVATTCVTLVATVPSLPWIAGSLVIAGLFQAGVQLTRNLSLRAALPARAHAAGYSVLYAATGVGYAGSAILAGVVQRAASPEVAILVGAALTLLLTAVSALAEFAPRWRAPVRRSVNPVTGGGECASESRLVPGRRARAATATQRRSPSRWASVWASGSALAWATASDSAWATASGSA
jgi:MFS family permease